MIEGKTELTALEKTYLEKLRYVSSILREITRIEDDNRPVEALARSAKKDFARLRRIEAAAREYVDACIKAAETKDWDDMSATDKQYNELAAALKES